MKLWRQEAEKHNKIETARQLANGDIVPGQRIRHQGRKNKSDIGRQYMNAASPLLMALLRNVGALPKQEAQV